jgi:hypothetical protein
MSPALRSPDSPRETGHGRVEGAPGALLALAVFGAVRLAGVVLLIVVDAVAGRPFGKSLVHAWDSVWYLHIAEHGYGTQLRITSTGAVQTDWAFFPLYPGLIRALCGLVPLTAGQAGLLIAWGFAALAVYGIYTITHHLYGRTVATAVVALWAVLPQSVALTLAYTEPLFTACAAPPLADRGLTGAAGGPRPAERCRGRRGRRRRGRARGRTAARARLPGAPGRSGPRTTGLGGLCAVGGTADR